MRLSHASYEKYLIENEGKFLGHTYFSPLLLNNETLVFVDENKSKDAIVISLSRPCPCFYSINTDRYFSSLETSFFSHLKAFSDRFMLVDYEFSKTDFILVLRFAISNKEDEDLIFNIELFPNHPNLIITNVKGTIDAALYHDRTRPLLHGEKYVAPKSEKTIDGEQEISSEFLASHFNQQFDIRKQEKYADFLSNFKGKIKKVRTKINNIQNDVNTAKSNEYYQQIADNLLCLGLNLKERKSSILLGEQEVKLDESKTISDNIQHFYKIAKKSKQTIALAEKNLEAANIELNQYLEIIEKMKQETSEKELDKIVAAYKPNRKRETTQTEFNKPYKINFNGTFIYFGKNASQNDYLSFVMKLDRQFTWLHIHNESGSHIVIANLKPTENEILFACELALHCSHKKAGEIVYTRKKNIRRGHTLGEAILKNYSIVKLNRIRDESIERFALAKRFD